MKSMGCRWLVVVAVILALAGCDRRGPIAPPRAVPVVDDGSIPLNLLTCNVRYENTGDRGTRAWQQRIIGTVRMIRREQPDILGVQEALHGQVADLWASLPEFEFIGVGRDDGQRTGEYAGIFFRRVRFRADRTDCGTFWLSATPEKPGSRTWGNEIPRIATWVRLVDFASGRGFYVFNTHWDHRNQPSREQAALLMAARIDGRQHPDEPVVLMGDFNVIHGNPALRHLRGERSPLAGEGKSWGNGLVDTFHALHPAQKDRRSLHFWRPLPRGDLKVDFIFVSKDARIGAAEIVTGDNPAVSDHYPVTATVVFPSQN